VIQTIRAKIIFTFIGLVLLNLVAAFWSIYNFYSLGTTVATLVRDNYRSVQAAENMVRTLERGDNALLLATEAPDSSVIRAFAESKEMFIHWYLEAVRSASMEDSLRDSIQASYQRYAFQGDRMNAMMRQGALREAKQFFYDEVRHTSDHLRDLCFQLFGVNQGAMYNAESKVHSLSNQTAFGTMVASIIALVLSILATAWLTKVVVTPAERLTETVRQIGKGKLDLKIDVLSDDEIGQLSREFNKMTERLRQYEQMNIERIIAEKRKSEAIVDSISDGLVVIDAEMQVLHLNRVLADLSGTDEFAAIGQPVGSVLRDRRLLSLLEDTMAGRVAAQEHKVQVLQFERGEKVLYYRPKLTILYNAEGGLYGVLMVLQDVTQFKELDRMKSDFIASLSHEFRTPVTSINMSVDILSRGILGPLNERQKELIDSAKGDCSRLTKLARELLQLSKLESGKLQLKNEELDLRGVIETCVRALQVQFNEKGVTLLPELRDGLPRLLADEQLMTSVVTNLLSNALKYTDAGGRVVVRLCQEGQSLRVDIQDTGHGVAREHLEDIFDKFVQVKLASESTPGSVGLGLAIAKEVVELYGGRIWAESEMGKGSVFSFSVPLPQEEPAVEGGSE
jgi:NtrC-family two-component system sensor histidine kinase KinB